jgi:hypothetical protein
VIEVEEYPPNHVVREDDGSVTLVRYRFEMGLSERVIERERVREHQLAWANILGVLRNEPMSSGDLREAVLFDRHTIAWVCMNLEHHGEVVHRDGKWRLAS